MGRFVPNEPGLRHTLTSRTGLVGRFGETFARKVAISASVRAPIKTGRLKGDIRILNVTSSVTEITWLVGSDAVNPDNGYMYPKVVHEGYKKKRYARPGNKMKFKVGGKYVVKSVVGPIVSQPFLRDALRDQAAHSGSWRYTRR